MAALASCVCGPGLSPADVGDGGASSTAEATHGTTEGDEPTYDELWRLSLDRQIWTEPPVGDELGNVYLVVSRDPPVPGPELKSLVKVSEGGELVWELDFGSTGGFAGVAVGPSGDAWACIRGAVSRVTPGGSVLWTEDDACTGQRSIAVGHEISVSVNLRLGEDEFGGSAFIAEVVAIDGNGIRSWARDVGVPVPLQPEQFKRIGSAIAGVALSGTSVYVGCDICSE